VTAVEKADDMNNEIRVLLRKSLILRLFELGVTQANIAKKLKMDIKAVNEFLKGIKRANGERKERDE